MNNLEFKVPLTAWHQLKVFPNGEEDYSLKFGKAQVPSKEREIKADNSYTQVLNLKRSARRVYSVVSDICRSNDFVWFITLTFSSKYDRQDDNETRKLFEKWRKWIKLKYPSMFYIAVAEYHKKGALHWHLLAGGISSDELYLSYFGDVKCMGEMIPVYTVGAWKYGYSTCSKIQRKENCNSYVMKYVLKAETDVRFFRRQRFTCSQNCIRPEYIKYCDYVKEFDIEKMLEDFNLQLDYCNEDYRSYKMSSKNNYSQKTAFEDETVFSTP